MIKLENLQSYIIEVDHLIKDYGKIEEYLKLSLQ